MDENEVLEQENNEDTPSAPVKNNLVKMPDGEVLYNELRLNGRVLTSTVPVEFNFKLKKNGTNLDMLLEMGDNIDYGNVTIKTNDVDKLIITDCAGNSEGITPTELKIGKNKLIQIPYVEFDSKTVTLQITANSSDYTVILNIETSASLPVYGAKLSQNYMDLNSDGDEGFPLSSSNLPIILTSDEDITLNYTTSDSDGYITLYDGLYVNLCYDPNVIDLINRDNIEYPPELEVNDDDYGDDGDYNDTTDMNNPIFRLKEGLLDIDNIYKSDFYIPIVVEYKNEDGKIISSRSFLLTRMFLKLVDTWGKELTKIKIDKDDIGDGSFRYDVDLLTPRYSTILTPYIKQITNDHTDARDTALDLLSYMFIATMDTYDDDYDDASSGMYDSDNTNYSLEFGKSVTNYKLVLTMIENGPVTFNSQCVVNNNNYYISDIVATKSKLETGTIITLEDAGVVLEKTIDKYIPFNVTEAATIEVKSIQENGPEFDIEYESEYIISLPHNGKKTYPEIYGNLHSNPDPEVEDGVYDYNLIAKDSDGLTLKEYDFRISVRRPIAVANLSMDVETIYVDIDRYKTTVFKGFNIFQIEIDPNTLDGYTAALSMTKHSDEINISGTYDECEFELILACKKPLLKKITLICRDEDMLEIGKFDFDIEFYTSKYDSSYPDPVRGDIHRGLIVKTSYTERPGYGIPAAFINNGEELAGVLVGKYPIPQESFILKKEGKSYTDLSKPNLHRVTHIPQNVVGLNENEEGGELVRVSDPTWTTELLSKVIENETLGSHTYPVMNSVYLDTMLSYIKDSNMSNMYTKQHITYGVPYASNAVDEYSYGVACNIYSELNDGIHWKNRLTNESLITEKYDALNDYVDSRDDYAIPIIQDDLYHSHNGTDAGVMDIGIGLKTYTDVRITSDDKGNLYLECLNPYDVDISHNGNNKEYYQVEFTDGKFLSNVPFGYIGPNDYTTSRKHYTFSNELYEDDPNAYLMDNMGIPMNNIIYTYATNNAFPGMAGVSAKKINRYVGSTYCMDFDKIKKESIGYLNNGGWYLTVTDDGQGYDGYDILDPAYSEHTVIKYDKEDPNLNPDHLMNVYSDVATKQSIGIYSRWLIDHNTVYNINKNVNRINDQMLFNNRIHYLIYDKDKISKSTPTKCKVLNKYIKINLGETAKVEFEGDTVVTVVTEPDTSVVKRNVDVLTANNPGETKIRYLAQTSETYNPLYIMVYVKVIDPDAPEEEEDEDVFIPEPEEVPSEPDTPELPDEGDEEEGDNDDEEDNNEDTGDEDEEEGIPEVEIPEQNEESSVLGVINYKHKYYTHMKDIFGVRTYGRENYAGLMFTANKVYIVAKTSTPLNKLWFVYSVPTRVRDFSADWHATDFTWDSTGFSKYLQRVGELTVSADLTLNVYACSSPNMSYQDRVGPVFPSEINPEDMVDKYFNNYPYIAGDKDYFKTVNEKFGPLNTIYAKANDSGTGSNSVGTKEGYIYGWNEYVMYNILGDKVPGMRYNISTSVHSLYGQPIISNAYNTIYNEGQYFEGTFKGEQAILYVVNGNNDGDDAYQEVVVRLNKFVL